jgi:uncharacterized protein (TIGR03435 family)
MRYVIAALLALTVTVGGQAPSQEFDVASIRRNTTDVFGRYIPPAIRSGQFTVTAMTMQEIVLFAYPLQTAPAQVLGLPDWARSEHYDVAAKLKADANAAELQQMWRALLADRVKLQAHYETRERDAYQLVLARADKRLGPQLQPSTVDCAKPPPLGARPSGLDGQIQMLQQRCVLGFAGSGQSVGLYSGGTSIPDLARSLTNSARRPVVDRTGLEGNYAVALRFASDSPPQAGAPAAATPDDPPLLTALQEQLGLKLQPATIDGQVLVVDRIERPTAD